MTRPSDYAVSNSEVLNSWKEVALYLGRGVRTVQRWEQELGLPVRRPRGKARSAVLALRAELDSWLLQTAVIKAPKY
jgi:phage terminase Nu1 subunit (DNA packaging protein)